MTKKKNRFIKIYRKYHRWPGMAMAILILLFSFSGIIMNHRSFFSKIAVNRNYLPNDYKYQNWNLASIKGSLNLADGSSLVYGNVGIWSTSDNYKTFVDYNYGLPEGIDNRKAYDIIQTKNGDIFAGTFSGLYHRTSGLWEKIILPEKDERIVSLEEVDQTLFIMTRSNIYAARLSSKTISPERLIIPISINSQNQVSLFKTLWFIHSGEIFGLPGKLFTDFMGGIFIAISITGIIRFSIPYVRKRKKKKGKEIHRLNKNNRSILKWHNKLGYYPIVFLIILTITGMFLRPPLLIAIADIKVNKIPFTHLANENPWFDKFRMIAYDKEAERLIISTTDGMYYSEDLLSTPLKRFINQPPVSVMGINVFEKISTNLYMVGSFSGLFIWNPTTGFLEDFIEGKPVENTGGRPVGKHIISGFLVDQKDNAFIFDYNNGVINPEPNNSLPEIPTEILNKSPMSLWNLCLEIHTGRIFKNLIGDFYILMVPLSGIFLLIVLVSGLLLYLKYNKIK